jgi:hypothetical protein
MHPIACTFVCQNLPSRPRSAALECRRRGPSGAADGGGDNDEEAGYTGSPASRDRVTSYNFGRARERNEREREKEKREERIDNEQITIPGSIPASLTSKSCRFAGKRFLSTRKSWSQRDLLATT